LKVGGRDRRRVGAAVSVLAGGPDMSKRAAAAAAGGIETR